MRAGAQATFISNVRFRLAGTEIKRNSWHGIYLDGSMATVANMSVALSNGSQVSQNEAGGILADGIPFMDFRMGEHVELLGNGGAGLEFTRFNPNASLQILRSHVSQNE